MSGMNMMYNNQLMQFPMLYNQMMNNVNHKKESKKKNLRNLAHHQQDQKLLYDNQLNLLNMYVNNLKDTNNLKPKRHKKKITETTEYDEGESAIEENLQKSSSRILIQGANHILNKHSDNKSNLSEPRNNNLIDQIKRSQLKKASGIDEPIRLQGDTIKEKFENYIDATNKDYYIQNIEFVSGKRVINLNDNIVPINSQTQRQSPYRINRVNQSIDSALPKRNNLGSDILNLIGKRTSGGAVLQPKSNIEDVRRSEVLAETNKIYQKYQINPNSVKNSNVDVQLPNGFDQQPQLDQKNSLARQNSIQNKSPFYNDSEIKKLAIEKARQAELKKEIEDFNIKKVEKNNKWVQRKCKEIESIRQGIQITRMPPEPPKVTIF